MTLQEFYKHVGGDYQDVIIRLIDEEHAKKYINMFVQNDCYREFLFALEHENWEDAFRGIHSLKGMCATLGFTKLYDVSLVLCEELRNGKPEVEITKMLDDVAKEYEATLETIKGLE